MYSPPFKINQLITRIIYCTKKSKRQTTPSLFKNPKLTPYGLIQKQPKSYDYNLPEDLPNRHLYYQRTEHNRTERKRYHEHRLYKLKINPIHDHEGKRTYNRQLSQIIYELTSLPLIKASHGRTFANLQQFVTRFKEESIGKGTEKGIHNDVLQFTMKQLHERYLSTMSFYQFQYYCHLREKAEMEPTENILTHFYKFLKAMKDLQNDKVPIEKVTHLTNYIFKRSYPEEFNTFFYRKKEKEFQLFEEGSYLIRETFEDAVKELYTDQYLLKVTQDCENHQVESICQAMMKLPGGNQLVDRIKAQLN